MPEPLVLLPGLQSDHRSWVHQIRHFEQQREVIVPYGHQFRDSIADMADSVLEQLPERFHLAAWSMGGYIAFQMLEKIRDRLASLILVSTSARPEDAASTPRRFELIALAEKEGMAVSQKLSISQSCLDAGGLDPASRKGIYQAAVDIGLEAYKGQQRAIINRPDTRSTLSSIDCPTLVIVGASDTVTPPDCAREIHAAIAGSRLEIVADCGHCAPLEYPDLTNRLFGDWLKATDHQDATISRKRLG